jgi:CubicO group peptidase (beta-lactamase class C family)
VSDTERIAAALADIRLHEPSLPREMGAWLGSALAGEPWPYVMGPVLDRGAPNGVVWVGGEEVARWGDPGRREMTFSIAKSALGTLAGLAFDDGLIPDLDEPVVTRVPLTAFGGDVYGPGVPHDAAAARRITWRHLLTQTSEWRGTLFDVPWWADPQGNQQRGGPSVSPGTRFSYNDVRTTLCSLALTHLRGEDNATTFGARVLEPLGCEPGWSWHGLDQMRTRLGGEEVAVTTGGSHWGGGLWLSAEDLARLGHLQLRGGEWDGRRILGEEWCRRTLVPTHARHAYGLMWWRNPEAGVPVGTERSSPPGAVGGPDALYPGAGVRGFAAQGSGEQIVWCDPDRDLVAVVRWVAELTPVLAAITAAVPVPATT